MHKKSVQLRKFKKSDWQDIFEYLSDEEVVKFEPYEVYTKEESKICAEERANSEMFYAIEVEDYKVIGNVYLSQYGPDHFRTWIIGYVLNSKYWGKGYASEAVQELLRLLFDERNAHRVIARCNTKNISSWKLLERNGFRREGEYKKNAYFSKDASGNPNWHNAYVYSMLEEEWNMKP